MLDFIGTAVALLVALGTFAAWRSDQLRRNEVLEWGMRCTEVLQILHLRCTAEVDGGVDNAAAVELAERVSVLVEQGRVFFKNASPDKYGTEKELAYRGYRPVILDQLVFACMVAKAWTELPLNDRKAGAKVITCCKERFVSLLQREVGRRRAADRYNIEGGSSADLSVLLSLANRGEFLELPNEVRSITNSTLRLIRF